MEDRDNKCWPATGQYTLSGDVSGDGCSGTWGKHQWTLNNNWETSACVGDCKIVVL